MRSVLASLRADGIKDEKGDRQGISAVISWAGEQDVPSIHTWASFLLPPSPLDWLPEGHLARFILDLVKELDLSKIYGHYEKELRGYPPHHPQMMVALLLCGYCVGVPSSRKIERKTHEDVAFRVIRDGFQPHTTLPETSPEPQIPP
jgi:hypothetical protein